MYGYWRSLKSSQLPGNKPRKKPLKACRHRPLSAVFTHTEIWGGFFGKVKPQVQGKKPGATRDRITIKHVTARKSSPFVSNPLYMGCPRQLPLWMPPAPSQTSIAWRWHRATLQRGLVAGGEPMERCA